MRIEFKMIALMATALLAAGAHANATVIYSADFSTPGIGWTHTTGSPLPSASGSTSGSNWTIGYSPTVNTDSSANTFITAGGALTSSDWGGPGYFESVTIDVTGYDVADIDFTGSGSWAGGSDYLAVTYTIDGGTPVSQNYGTDSSFTNFSFSAVPLTGATTLTVGFNFSMNGTSDAFSFSSIAVDAEATGGPPSSSDVLFMETFETDGEGSRYTVTPTGSGSGEDYFDRVSNATTDRSYTGMEGTWYFGAQDADTVGADPGVVLFEDIDISGYENLEFSGLFAEQRPEASGEDDIDAGDYAIIEFRIDDGSWQNLLHFQNDGTTFNTTFLEDTNFDGTGDGTQLESAFAEFVKSISGTGSLLDLRFTIVVDSGDEDFAFDSLKITGTAIESVIPAPAALPVGLAMLGLMMGRRRRR